MVRMAYKNGQPLELKDWQLQNLAEKAREIAEKYESGIPFCFRLGHWVLVRWEHEAYPGIHIRHACGTPGIYVRRDRWNDLLKVFHDVMMD